jgi:dolichol-phosphate mannosyltransferase
MNNNPLVSVILPAYNESENLAPLTEEIEGAMRIADITYEIIFVDDGSTDQSAQVLDLLSETRKSVRSIRHLTNFGQSAAQASGFRAALGEVVITMDADLQNDPADIPALLEALTEGVDCVCGVRVVRRDNFVRRVSSKIANCFRNLITGDRVADSGCTYRAMRKTALAEVPLFNGMHRFIPTILRAQGFNVIEIPVNHRERSRGVSKYGINDRLWRGIRDCFAVRWYRARAVHGTRLRHE